MQTVKLKEPFYYIGKQYDAQNKKYREDIPFYLNQCRKYGGPVLELACGTGRVTIPIAKEGFDITGIDISWEMLKAARESAADAEIKIHFKRVDARKFKLSKKFKVIIYPFNSIAHLYDIKSILDCLIRVKKHLLPGGKFIFDIFNPDLNRLVRKKSKLPVKKYFYDEPGSGKKVIISEHTYYDGKTQISHINWHYNIEGNKFVEKLDMRIYFPLELDALLLYSGFKINSKFGNFDCSEFSSDSPKQIYICSLDKELGVNKYWTQKT
ncbi:MAG TPA: class I SAM-dependent methyltransferase [Ignavibacteria bacterium]|nr:class I SAM-dependent methyltransferase [Ignavibacteria bacterium]